MSTTTVSPMHVPLIADSEHAMDKVIARLSPPTSLVPLVQDDQLKVGQAYQVTFIVDLKSDNVQSTPQLKERTDVELSGEQTSGFDDAPSPSHGEPSTEGLPLVDVHVAKPPTPQSHDGDSESVRSPIDPPGLSEQIPSSASDSVGDSGPAEVRVGTVDAPAVSPAAAAPDEPDAIFSIDPRVFEWELAYDVCEPIFQFDLPLFEHDLSGFSLTDLAPLDTFIPDELFPDDLLVHDINNITSLHPDDTSEDSTVRHLPVRYVRISPKTAREQDESKNAYDQRDPSKPARVAHLYLESRNRMGSGHHSYVYRAPFRLRLDPASREWSTVSVAAKTANTECGAHLMLDKEAIAYSAFPREMMEDTLRIPPASRGTTSTDDAASESSPGALTTQERTTESTHMWDSSHDANCLGPAPQPAAPAEAPASESQAGEWEPAIVPKFYGYYGAVNADGGLHDERHRSCNIDRECEVEWPTRILLVEECGNPVAPYGLPRKERQKILDLTERMHKAGFVNNSPYTRNILSQPGPLSVPREERSYATRSYRIIDFGRSEVLSLLPESRHGYFKQCCDEDIDLTKRHLSL